MSFIVWDDWFGVDPWREMRRLNRYMNAVLALPQHSSPQSERAEGGEAAEEDNVESKEAVPKEKEKEKEKVESGAAAASAAAVDANEKGGSVVRDGGVRGMLMTCSPLTDVRETEKEYVVEVEMPGVKKEDVKVDVSGEVLRIRGETSRDETSEAGGLRRSERWRGTFERHLRLPRDTDADGIRARHENGVVSVTVPKKAPQMKAVAVAVQ